MSKTVSRREYMREYQRRWRALNPEKNRARQCKYQATNPDKYREQNRAWRLVNPERVRAYQQSNQAKRRASIRTSVTNAPTTDQLAALMKDPCVYCGNPSEHIDHVIPLSRGGTHDLDNLVPACAACNFSKGSKLPGIEWNGRKQKNSSVSSLDTLPAMN